MHKRNLAVAIAVVCLLVWNVVGPAGAQGSGPSLVVKQMNAGAFPEMSATVTVVNSSGVPIRDIAQANFELQEDGQPLAIKQVITEVSPDQPIAVALVLDLSGSAPLEDVKAAARQFLDSLGPNDRVALIGFNTPLGFDTFDPFKESDFTTDRDRLRSIIDGLTIVGQTAVYEAIYKAVLITAKEQADRRAVLVMTDGHDTHSRAEIATADTPKTAARDRRIPIFTVGVYSPDFPSNPDYLKVMASESGGRYQVASSPADLGNLFQDAVKQLRLQYRLAFSTERKPDGKDHVLTLRVTTPEGQASAQQTVTYPAPPAVPEIRKVQQDVNGTLEDMRDELKGTVLLVPDISAQNPVVKVEYSVDGKLTYTANVVAQKGKAIHQPWEWSWDTSPLTKTTHALTIIAYDDAGQASAPLARDVRVGELPFTFFGMEMDIRVVVALAAGVVLLLLFVLFLIINHANQSRMVVARQSMESATSPALPAMTPLSGYPPGPEGGAPAPGQAYAPSMPAPGGISPGMPGISPTQVMGGPSGGMAPGGGMPGYESGGGPAQGETMILRRKPEAMGWLVVQEGPLAGREFRLGHATAIGRAGNSDIVLDHASVSRQHAKIKLDGQAFWIYDLGATNSTIVNGREVSHVELNDGDQVEIGEIKLVFKQVRTGEGQSQGER